MLHGDVARYRTEDLLRTAEARRVGAPLAARRRAIRARTLRKVTATVTALLPIPLRH
jgi:hypothetical protein